MPDDHDLVAYGNLEPELLQARAHSIVALELPGDVLVRPRLVHVQVSVKPVRGEVPEALEVAGEGYRLIRIDTEALQSHVDLDEDPQGTGRERRIAGIVYTGDEARA